MRLSVPEPCHADWSTMATHTGGRHCSQCDHVVADLTRATDAELMSLFRGGSGPKCARFHVGQLDRILNARSTRPARLLPIAAFTSLLALLTGCETINQGEPAIHVDQEPTVTTPVKREQMVAPLHKETTDTAQHALQDTTAMDRSIEQSFIVGDIAVMPPEDHLDPWPIPLERDK